MNVQKQNELTTVISSAALGLVLLVLEVVAYVGIRYVQFINDLQSSFGS